MNFRLRTYWAYSIGCAVVWAVLLLVVAAKGTTANVHTYLLVFGGFAIGWTSATIARYVNPPPKVRAARGGGTP